MMLGSNAHSPHYSCFIIAFHIGNQRQRRRVLSARPLCRRVRIGEKERNKNTQFYRVVSGLTHTRGTRDRA